MQFMYSFAFLVYYSVVFEDIEDIQIFGTDS